MMERLSQKLLAERLGVTPRRVRQLIAENILPGPDSAGGYDAAECEARFLLFSGGSPQAWSRFFDAQEADGAALSQLRETAWDKRATLEEIGAYGRAVIRWHSRLKFAQAVHYKADETSALITRLAAIDEASAFDDVLQTVDAYNARQAPKGKKPVPLREQILARGLV
jgi:hypothetical protein